MIYRLLAVVLIAASIFTLPWWLTLLFAVLAMLAFRRFYEALILALVMDAIYAVPEAGFYGVVFVSFLSVLIIFGAIEFLKQRLLMRW